ncbi:MAG: type II toxin-antitoxin system HicB family antitoxin [Clostridia bacterium]|nr:MAG: type II toxin-antitoxin system HicB family antitoxin [Clostridia bacterium]
MATKGFRVILEWDSSEQVYVATVPALPGCVSQGATRDQALERIQEAIEGYLEAIQAEGLPLPANDVDVTEVQVQVGL